MASVKVSTDLVAILEGRFDEVNPHLAPTGLDNLLTRIETAYGEMPTSSLIQNTLARIKKFRIVLSASSKLPVHLQYLEVESAADQVIGYSLLQVLAGNAKDQYVQDVRRELADVFDRWIKYLDHVFYEDHRVAKPIV